MESAFFQKIFTPNASKFFQLVHQGTNRKMSNFRKRSAKPLWSKIIGLDKDGPIKDRRKRKSNKALRECNRHLVLPFYDDDILCGQASQSLSTPSDGVVPKGTRVPTFPSFNLPPPMKTNHLKHDYASQILSCQLGGVGTPLHKIFHPSIDKTMSCIIEFKKSGYTRASGKAGRGGLFLFSYLNRPNLPSPMYLWPPKSSLAPSRSPLFVSHTERNKTIDRDDPPITGLRTALAACLLATMS
ncbi:5022_t:CDS:2 [Acaulospora morrowiae]|uniref:5022_t:CDS:1 n=1 Tax=Acaulospora morrowiae TaxID=94023 RepID=A0A9N9BW44_9GLOM|nr:5022_t:CDS:2 [Acaulospora morrowiae]